MSTSEDKPEDEKTKELSVAQKVRMERNRQRALLLRSSRLTSHPYASEEAKTVHVGGSRVVDSGGGFFIDEDENEEEELVNAADLPKQPGPIIDGSEDLCEDCHKKFSDSYLLKHFDVQVCDACRSLQKDEAYKMITKTDARQKFCLKDCDFDIREPPLKFIVRKNPHNERWGDMKLYLELQVHKRAMEVWGDEETLEEQKEKRVDNKEKAKRKKYEKRIKELRKAVRTSTWQKDLSKHVHDYDSENEVYDEEEDVYTKKCKTCDHQITYEKM